MQLAEHTSNTQLSRCTCMVLWLMPKPLHAELAARRTVSGSNYVDKYEQESRLQHQKKHLVDIYVREE